MTGLYVDSIKDASNTKTLATLSSSAVNLSTDVTVPATTSACVKLYSNSVSGVASFEVDGYFDDTKYAYYELHLSNIKQTNTETSKHFAGQIISGGSAQTSSDYWTTGTGSYSDNGTTQPMDTTDIDGDLSYFYLDQTWYLSTTGDAPRSMNAIMKFSEPSSTTRYFQAMIWAYGNGHNAEDRYRVNQSTTGLSWENTNAVTGFKFLKHTGATATLEGSVSLFGFRK